MGESCGSPVQISGAVCTCRARGSWARLTNTNGSLSHMKQTSTSIFGILAREAPTGVLIRRGPSSQTQLIKWNLKDDTFEEGQWLKARVYERRCDLSPQGTLLIYFAATYK